ncbi:MAG: GNAT family N-acetyltransferase [Planctomycetaceae bacterium]
MIGLIELHDLTSLEQYRMTWDDLWRQTLPKSFCQSYAWFSAYARHFLPENSLRVLVASVNGKTLGIVPLVIRHVETGVGTLRMLTYPRCSWGSIDRPIGPHPTAAIMLAMRHLQQSPADWDLIDLREIRDGGGNHSRLSNSLRNAGLAFRHRNWDAQSTVCCETDWWTYWSNRPAPLKERAASAYRDFARQGEIELIRQREMTPQSQVRSRQFSSYTGRWGNQFSGVDLWTQFESVADLPQRDVAFLREVHPKAAQLGMADLAVLRVGREPIAAAYGWHAAGDVTNCWLGQGTDQPESAGTLLMETLLQDGFARGDRQMRLRGDEHPAFADWETDRETTSRFTHFSTTSPRAQMLRLNQYVRQLWHGPDTAHATIAGPKSIVPAPRFNVVG